MYEYKFVRIELKGVVEMKPEENYRSIIEQHAAQGWRFVQIFAPGTYGHGTASYFEIIFEREKK